VSLIPCQTNLKITNHRGHKFPSSVTLLSFKTRIKWRPVLTATACFPSVFFQLRQYSRKHSSFSAHKAALMTKTELIFQAFSLILVDFAVQFCFRCKFSFHEKPFESSLTEAWFFLANHNSLLRHSNQWDCFILYRQQITSNGKGRLSSNWERFWNKKLKFWFFFYCIKQIDSMLPYVCSVNRPQRTSKCGKNISDTLDYRLVCHFFVLTTFWRHLWSITEQTQGNMDSIC